MGQQYDAILSRQEPNRDKLVTSETIPNGFMLSIINLFHHRNDKSTNCSAYFSYYFVILCEPINKFQPLICKFNKKNKLQ